MTDWLADYAETADLNERYRMLRDELARLRGQRDRIEFYDDEAVAQDIRRLSEGVSGDLVVFVANDFGRPRAFRPPGMAIDVQDEIRQAVLEDKYDASHEDLNAIRRELLAAHPAIHKLIVATHSDAGIRYHLPEGSTETTNFLTVREMVGLVDYTTNSFQREGLSVTY